MSDRRFSRRQVLGTLGAGLAGALAGCEGGRFTATDGATGGEGGARSLATTTGQPAQGDNESVFTRVYRQTIGSVVFLQVFTDLGGSQGTGFVYGEPGRLLTNQHVVAGANRIDVRFTRREWREAEVVGTDVYSDLAVLEVEDPPGYATPLSFQGSPPVIGQQVVAIGSPFGLAESISAGIVSGVNRSVATDGGFSIPNSIQTDAAANPGNSGGPLVDLDAEVLGVVSSGINESVVFAVSGAIVRRVVPSLVETGSFEHPFMGVSLLTVTPTIATANRLETPRGVLVVRVIENGPADGVLQPSRRERTVNGVDVPTGGDVIVGLGDQRIDTLGQLSSYLVLETRPGETIPVTVLRDGQRRTVELTLGTRPPPDDVATGG